MPAEPCGYSRQSRADERIADHQQSVLCPISSAASAIGLGDVAVAIWREQVEGCGLRAGPLHCMRQFRQRVVGMARRS